MSCKCCVMWRLQVRFHFDGRSTTSLRSQWWRNTSVPADKLAAVTLTYLFSWPIYLFRPHCLRWSYSEVELQSNVSRTVGRILVVTTALDEITWRWWTDFVRNCCATVTRWSAAAVAAAAACGCYGRGLCRMARLPGHVGLAAVARPCLMYSLRRGGIGSRSTRSRRTCRRTANLQRCCSECIQRNRDTGCSRRTGVGTTPGPRGSR